MSMTIGGSDGPTAVFLAGTVGEDWFNPFGLFFILMMLLPNMLYAVRSKGREKKKCDKKYMVIIEQIGRYASMFLLERDLSKSGTACHCSGCNVCVFRYFYETYFFNRKRYRIWGGTFLCNE